LLWCIPFRSSIVFEVHYGPTFPVLFVRFYRKNYILTILMVSDYLKGNHQSEAG
jgi:hypothetical protein